MKSSKKKAKSKPSVKFKDLSSKKSPKGGAQLKITSLKVKGWLAT
jgi:hypothetical protein